MSNIIATRIADFLKQFPPFDLLEKKEIDRLSVLAVVQYFASKEYVFKQGQDNTGLLYIVKEGKVNLEKQQQDAVILVDVCDEGDLFGVRAMLTGNPYVFHARCDEECLIYAFPIKEFKEILERNTDVALFFAAGLAGGQQPISQDLQQVRLPYQESGSLLNWNRPLDKLSKKLVTVEENTSIHQAAMLMNQEEIGSLLILDNQKKPIGIVTNTDFRTKMAAEKVSFDKPVAEIASKDLVTMPLGLPLSSYLLEMLRKGIRHLAISQHQDLIGILSERDLMGAHQNHPVTLAFAMEKAKSIEELIELRTNAESLVAFYLEQNVAIQLTASLISHINDVLIRKAISFALSDLDKQPPVAFAWLSLGSEAREEQLIRTDQDNALVFADGGDEEENQAYFLKLSKKTNEILNMAGFAFCPAEMMASNPKWCKSLNSWKRQFTKWIREPEEKALMMASIFFDFRIIYGDPGLSDKLQNHIDETIGEEKIFLNFLAKNALKNPAPLGFFKNLMVERSGVHKDEFDLKLRAMMPLVDSARVLSLEKRQLSISNTMARFEHLAKEESKNASLYKSAAEAYQFLLRLRAVNGIRNNDSGRYIPISDLTKLERQILRNSFEPIDELQSLLTVRYQLDHFRS